MRSEIITPNSAAQATGMVRIAPDRAISDLVEQHWIVTWDNRGVAPARREVLPDPSVNLAIEPGGRLLYGVGSGHGVRLLEDRGMVIGTKFRPGGFSGFTPGSVSDLSGHVLTLPEAFGTAGEHLDAALAAAPEIPTAIAVVTDFLRRRRPAPDPRRELVMEIVKAMRGAGPDASVNRIARDFAVSPRTLQRLFTRHVGATPKDVLQRFRRQRAVDLLGEPGAPSLARIAAELGYSDQSHLTRDFRATLGRSPSALALASPQAWPERPSPKGRQRSRPRGS
jgi:AraC-like DNA-binding protein